MSKPSKNIFKDSAFAEQEPAEASAARPGAEKSEPKTFKTIFKDDAITEQEASEVSTSQLPAESVERKTFKTIFKTEDLDDVGDVDAAEPDQVLAADSITKFNKASKRETEVPASVYGQPQEKIAEPSGKKKRRRYYLAVIAVALLLVAIFRGTHTEKAQSAAVVQPEVEKTVPPQPVQTTDNRLSPAAAKGVLLGMLAAANKGDAVALDASLRELESVASPAVGDRKAARLANESGLAALKNQDYSAAIAGFKQGLAADPSDVEVLNNLGFALYLGGDLIGSKGVIEQCLLYAPQRAAAWVNLGDIFFKEGKYDEGVNAYLLAYKFTKKREKLYKFVENQAENDPDPHVRMFYTRVLNALQLSRL